MQKKQTAEISPVLHPTVPVHSLSTCRNRRLEDFGEGLRRRPATVFDDLWLFGKLESSSTLWSPSFGRRRGGNVRKQRLKQGLGGGITSPASWIRRWWTAGDAAVLEVESVVELGLEADGAGGGARAGGCARLEGSCSAGAWRRRGARGSLSWLCLREEEQTAFCEDPLGRVREELKRVSWEDLFMLREEEMKRELHGRSSLAGCLREEEKRSRARPVFSCCLREEEKREKAGPVFFCCQPMKKRRERELGCASSAVCAKTNRERVSWEGLLLGCLREEEKRELGRSSPRLSA